MTLDKTLRTVPVVAACLLVLSAAAAVAQKKFMVLNTARPQVKILLSGSVERANARIPLGDDVTVKTGEILNWTITSTNEGNAPAREYKAIGLVPPGTEFIAGSVSADGSAKVTYSIDHGRNFSVSPTIEQKQPDGTMKRVPAPTSMYTQIRYEWTDPLSQGAKLVASYKVRLN